MEENYLESSSQEESVTDPDFERFSHIPKYIPHFLVYRSMRTKTGSGKYNFQFTLEEDPLFAVKLKSKNQIMPIPIGIGTTVHYSDNNTYYLIPSKNHHKFTLMKDGEAIFIAKMKNLLHKNKPKHIEAHWIPNDGTEQYHLKNVPPEHSNGQEYLLDFEGRFAVPSIKNAIFINSETHEIAMMMRRLDKWEMNVEALPSLPNLFVFALLISVNVCPF